MTNLPHLVVGLDESASSRHALAWACRQQPGNVHVINAVSPATELWFGALQADSRRVLDARRENLDQACESVDLLPGTKIEAQLSEEEPARALLDGSHDEGSCPIVVGHQGHTSWHNHHVGHVTTELLRDSDVPVIVVPHEAPLERVIGKIAVCAHGATSIDHPDVAWAVELAMTNDLGLHLIDVVEPIPIGVGATYGYGSVMIPTAGQLQASRSELLQDLRGQIQAKHPAITVDLSVESGHPLIKLALVINDVAPSLVVIGNHHHSKLLSLLTSAIATHLPTAIHCPMAAIPIPA